MKTLITISRSAVIKTIFNSEAINRLNAISEVDWVDEDKAFTAEHLASVIEKYDAVISSWGSPKLTREVLDRAVNLKFVGHAAGSVVAFMDPYIFEKSIHVVNANRTMAYSTAELTLALMIAGSWDIYGFTVRMREGKWSDNGKGTVPGIAGQTIGLIGYGEISKEVIRLLKPFNPNILVYSSYCPQKEADENGFELSSLEELLKKCDIVSLHNTLTPRTRGMIGKEQLKLLKNGALVINTARGPIIDETALIDELKAGRIFAALDVFNKEPLPADSEFYKLQNALCVPHIGALSAHYKTRMALSVIEDMERWLIGEKLQGSVDLEKYNRMTPG